MSGCSRNPTLQIDRADIGLRAPATARRFFGERAEWKAHHEREARRRREGMDIKYEVAEWRGPPGHLALTSKIHANHVRWLWLQG